MGRLNNGMNNVQREIRKDITLEEILEHSSPMLDCRNNSPELTKNPRTKTFKSRRKLPFSEKFESSTSDADPDSCDSFESSKSKVSCPKIAQRTTPLSERQQIALLCKLSASDQSPTAGTFVYVAVSQSGKIK